LDRASDFGQRGCGIGFLRRWRQRLSGKPLKATKVCR
jgi:hypothetical protein